MLGSRPLKSSMAAGPGMQVSENQRLLSPRKSPARPEAVEITGQDSLQSLGIDAELLQPRELPARHIVAFQQAELVKGEQRMRQQAQQRGLEPGERHGYGQEQAPAAYLGQEDLHQLLEAVCLWAGELVCAAGSVGILQCRHGRIGHVADIDGLEAGAPAADERQGRQELGHFGEAVEEVVLRPEDDAGPEDGRRWNWSSTWVSPAAFERP